MKKFFLLSLVIACFLSVMVFANAQKEDSTSVQKSPETVKFWYLWGGTEATYLGDLVAEYNASQDKYVVKGLSVPDMQKILVAISGGEGPDITDNFSTNTAGYAGKGIIEPLDGYIKKDNYDLSDFMQSAIESVTFNGKVYALPISVNLMMMFYNKDLLQKAGYTQPPKTDKELLEYAEKLTEVDSKGNIKVLGFPDFPAIYYPLNMSYALGGNFQDGNGKLTPNNSGSRKALNLIVKYRSDFGVQNVLAINSSGGYLSPADPFVVGKQALRIDGPWFGNTVHNVLKVDLNYGVAPLPYPKGHPELARSGLVNTSMFYIPSNAKNKEGAWAFMSWLLKKAQMVKLSQKMGWIPARISALNDPAFNNAYDFKKFSSLAKSKNLKVFPVSSVQSEYNKIIMDAFDKAELLKVTPDKALKEAEEKSAALQ